MKIKNTKKAYTLVELLVTIAILSITATMGIGIFSSAMQNYSSASVTAKEQEKAYEIENFILRHARVASDVYFITNDNSLYSNSNYIDHIASTEAAISLDDAIGGVITCEADSKKFSYHDKFFDEDSDVISDGDLTIIGIDSIEFGLRKQKANASEASDDSFAYLTYKINMSEGYSVNGAVMLYNCSNIVFPYDPDNFVETTTDTAANTFKVGDPDFNTGIAFLKK